MPTTCVGKVMGARMEAKLLTCPRRGHDKGTFTGSDLHLELFREDVPEV